MNQILIEAHNDGKTPHRVPPTLRSKEEKETNVPSSTHSIDASFEQIAKEVGRDEVSVAAIFYAQAKPSVPTPQVRLTFDSQTI
jgi:hypothetical protein